LPLDSPCSPFKNNLLAITGGSLTEYSKLNRNFYKIWGRFTVKTVRPKVDVTEMVP